jgi:hypothetical protein
VGTARRAINQVDENKNKIGRCFFVNPRSQMAAQAQLTIGALSLAIVTVMRFTTTTALLAKHVAEVELELCWRVRIKGAPQNDHVSRNHHKTQPWNTVRVHFLSIAHLRRSERAKDGEQEQYQSSAHGGGLWFVVCVCVFLRKHNWFPL